MKWRMDALKVEAGAGVTHISRICRIADFQSAGRGKKVA
jgi:hypothetical protein